MSYTLNVQGKRGWTSYYGLSFDQVDAKLPKIKADCRVELEGRTVGGVEKRRNDQGREVWTWWVETPCADS